ncbi:MAG TPA: hypothetical protein VK790_06540 [Solirubrobacteraceae bacterium]|jgi:GGDEF domain-containing protein|nr:hypothetical protein [Solirubrobacteraceae bacterium]
MAASDTNPRIDPSPPGALDCLGPAAARERLDEEINRAERYGSGLSCLLVRIENLDQMAREHGAELREQTVAYVAAALRRELRRFDRIAQIEDGHEPDEHDTRGAHHEREPRRDLLIILPGADSARGEAVARRALERMRTIKVEAGGARRPLEISVGLAAWRRDTSVDDLLAQARAAIASINGDSAAPQLPPPDEDPPAPQTPQPQGARTRAEDPPVVGRAGSS